jgi:hypothetical protein
MKEERHSTPSYTPRDVDILLLLSIVLQCGFHNTSFIGKRLIVALTGPGPQVALGPKRTFSCFFCCFSADRPLQTAKNKNVKRFKNKTLKRRNDHICGLKKGERSEPFARRRHKLRIRTRLRRTPELGFLVFFCRIFIFLGPVWG